MPMYEYECTSCKEITTDMKKIVDREECPKCPKCQKATRKITTQMQFKLKGRGWAADGYTGQKGHADLV